MEEEKKISAIKDRAELAMKIAEILEKEAGREAFDVLHAVVSLLFGERVQLKSARP
jgi:hypothetical protein